MAMSADSFYADVVDKYTKYINPFQARLMGFAGFGVEMRGDGCYIFDHDGRRFLDCLGGFGTFALGHRHPKVIEAVRAQLDTITLSGKAFFSKPSADLAEALAGVAPKGLQFSFFCNSGAEAVEGALKFAKGATQRKKIISTTNSFHGKTLGALSTMGREKYRIPFEPLIPGVEFVPYGDSEAASRVIDRETACMIVEPLQGEGGIIVPPDGYLASLREACDRNGALLICDEVQTGLGRTGKMWGCDHDGVSPDLMPLAKAIGGGVMPLGVMMGTPAVWEAVYSNNPFAHTSTFGGNPIACAAGLAGIKVVRDEGLPERAEVMGSLFKAALGEVKRKHPDTVAEIRGRGLMLGMEMAMDEVGELVVSQLLKRGMCVAYTLNNPGVLRIEPPLIINEEQIEFAARCLDESLAETEDLIAALI
jgi:putrescine aminotransferase